MQVSFGKYISQKKSLLIDTSTEELYHVQRIYSSLVQLQRCNKNQGKCGKLGSNPSAKIVLVNFLLGAMLPCSTPFPTRTSGWHSSRSVFGRCTGNDFNIKTNDKEIKEADRLLATALAPQHVQA